MLHKAFENAGCHVFTQGHTLGVPTGDVLKMLRQKLDQSEFVIHLAGLACGSGPDAPAFPEFADFR
ncbi:MAG: hypothetical protein ABIZ56_03040 [Chthoniobacteraceae bacterium]